METQKITTPDGTTAFYINLDGINKMHNWDSSAFIPKGNKREAEYYLFGIKMSKDEWLERKADINGLPWYKTAAGKASGVRV